MTYAHPEYLTSTEELAGLIAADPDQKTLRIFDASVILAPRPDGRGYRAEAGLEDYRAAHIPGAAFLDLMGALSDRDSKFGFTLPGADHLQQGFRAAGISDASRVIIYATSHMMWASRAWWMLHSCGHKNVSVLDGGLAKWQAEGRTTMTGDHTYAPGDVSVLLDARKWSDKADVLAAIGAGDICTLNALSSEVYDGSAEMDYGRKGHITGSQNIPYASILEKGCVRPADELQEVFNAKGILEKPKIIAYCGGGISATVDALALSLLGHENVSVYDGSMSEWASDEALPLKLGTEA